MTSTPTAATRVERPAPERDPHLDQEVRTAARSLLMTPLLVDRLHTDDLRLVRRHREELVRIFADGLGYRLVVEPSTARLIKCGLGRDGSRPWTRRSGAPFSPRAYALFALTVAALTRCRAQLLVDELVAQVRSAAVDASIQVDLDTATDRRALHAALTRLVDLGVLVERDGDLEHWADQRTQSLLDVRRDVLALLVSASVVGVQGPDELLDVAALPSAAGGARIELRRRLLESPLLSTGDLDDDQVEWWRRNRNREREWFADRFGLELELRAEGAIAVDPDDALSDLDFPGRGSVKQLALLLLAETVELAGRNSGSTSGPWRDVPAAEVVARGARVVARWGRGLKQELREDPAGACEQAVDVLVGVGLVRRDGVRLQVHAAAARYAPRASLAETSASGEQSLFDLAPAEQRDADQTDRLPEVT